MAGVPALRLAGLEPESAVRLLSASLPEPIDPAAAAQIAAATGGNPLALIDLARDLTARQLTESSLADEPVPVGRHLEAHYVRRVRHLHPDVQQWLLIAAADSTGNLDLIAGAGRGLGVPGSPRRRRRGGRPGAARHDRAVPAPARQVRRLQRRTGSGAAAGPCRARLRPSELGLVELEAWHAAQGHPGHRPGGCRPAGAGG